MLEYASRRLMFLCARATRFPTIMVSAASHHTAWCHVVRSVGNASSHNLKNAANAAALTAAAIYAVIGVGAPSYTSGAHIWNGAAATLNPKPTRSRATPTSSKAL